MTPEQRAAIITGVTATATAWLICAAALAWDYLL